MKNVSITLVDNGWIDKYGYNVTVEYVRAETKKIKTLRKRKLSKLYFDIVNDLNFAALWGK